MREVTILVVGEGENLRHDRKRLDHLEHFCLEGVSTIDGAVAILGNRLFDVVIVEGPMARLVEGIIRIRHRAPNVPILALPRREAEPELIERIKRIGATRCLSPATSGSELRDAVLSCA